MDVCLVGCLWMSVLLGVYGCLSFLGVYGCLFQQLIISLFDGFYIFVPLYYLICWGYHIVGCFFLSRALSTAALKLGCMLLGPYKYVFVVVVIIARH